MKKGEAARKGLPDVRIIGRAIRLPIPHSSGGACRGVSGLADFSPEHDLANAARQMRNLIQQRAPRHLRARQMGVQRLQPVDNSQNATVVLNFAKEVRAKMTATKR